MKTVLTVCGGVALLAALANPQLAHANIILNGNLETSLTPDAFGMVSASTSHNTAALIGWHITGPVDVVPNSYWQASKGNSSVDLIGTPGLGGISQRVHTIIGQDYDLTFDFAVNPENITFEAGSTKRLAVRAVAKDGDVDGILVFTGVKGIRTNESMHYVQETMTFTATTTSTTIHFDAMMPMGLAPSFNVSNVYGGPVIDNVDLEFSGSSNNPPPTVPEPASLGVLGLGAAALLTRRRGRGGRG